MPACVSPNKVVSSAHQSSSTRSPAFNAHSSRYAAARQLSSPTLKKDTIGKNITNTLLTKGIPQKKKVRGNAIPITPTFDSKESNGRWKRNEKTEIALEPSPPPQSSSCSFSSLPDHIPANSPHSSNHSRVSGQQHGNQRRRDRQSEESNRNGTLNNRQDGESRQHKKRESARPLSKDFAHLQDDAGTLPRAKSISGVGNREDDFGSQEKSSTSSMILSVDRRVRTRSQKITREARDERVGRCRSQDIVQTGLVGNRVFPQTTSSSGERSRRRKPTEKKKDPTVIVLSDDDDDNDEEDGSDTDSDSSSDDDVTRTKEREGTAHDEMEIDQGTHEGEAMDGHDLLSSEEDKDIMNEDGDEVVELDSSRRVFDRPKFEGTKVQVKLSPQSGQHSASSSSYIRLPNIGKDNLSLTFRPAELVISYTCLVEAESEEEEEDEEKRDVTFGPEDAICLSRGLSEDSKRKRENQNVMGGTREGEVKRRKVTDKAEIFRQGKKEADEGENGGGDGSQLEKNARCSDSGVIILQGDEDEESDEDNDNVSGGEQDKMRQEGGEEEKADECSNRLPEDDLLFGEGLHSSKIAVPSLSYSGSASSQSSVGCTPTPGSQQPGKTVEEMNFALRKREGSGVMEGEGKSDRVRQMRKVPRKVTLHRADKADIQIYKLDRAIIVFFAEPTSFLEMVSNII